MSHEILNEPLPDDYRGCYDRDFIGFWDLGGKDMTLKIARVQVGKLQAQQGEKKEKKLLIWFDRAEKGWIVNKTCAATIAGMYGNKPAEWIGKKITLFATTCSAFGKTVDCIRVRPKIPLESVKKETA